MTNTQAADRASYDEWRALQVLAYEATGATYWFDVNKELRMARRGSHAPADAFTGPYWAVKPYLTAEAIEWFEVAGNDRFTFTDWQRLERERRAAEAEFDAEESDPLRTLEYLRDAMQRRGALIVEARESGASWADVCAATGLSRMQASTIAKATMRSAELVPVQSDDEPF